MDLFKKEVTNKPGDPLKCSTIINPLFQNNKGTHFLFKLYSNKINLNVQ